jgi:hypothetical protein
MNPADEMAAKPDAAGFGGEPDKQLREAMYDRLLAIEKQRVGHQGNPVERDDHRQGFTSRLDVEASEHKAIHDRLVAIENETKRRGSRGFTRYLVAVLIGVAATLAWQSCGDAGKQVIATTAPELGWSPEARKMITSWVPVGWTKPPAGSEKQVVPGAQTAPQNVAPKAPTTASLDPEQLQQITQSLTTFTAGQDQMTRVIGRLESAVAELITKMPEPPPQPPAAPARKPRPVPLSSRAPGTPPKSLAPRPPPHP